MFDRQPSMQWYRDPGSTHVGALLISAWGSQDLCRSPPRLPRQDRIPPTSCWGMLGMVVSHLEPHGWEKRPRDGRAQEQRLGPCMPTRSWVTMPAVRYPPPGCMQEKGISVSFKPLLFWVPVPYSWTCILNTGCPLFLSTVGLSQTVAGKRVSQPTSPGPYHRCLGSQQRE